MASLVSCTEREVWKIDIFRLSILRKFRNFRQEFCRFIGPFSFALCASVPPEVLLLRYLFAPEVSVLAPPITPQEDWAALVAGSLSQGIDTAFDFLLLDHWDGS